MAEIYYVDSSERKTVDVLNKMDKNFKIVNNILWFCEGCNKIYEENPKLCECGSRRILSYEDLIGSTLLKLKLEKTYIPL